jgi:molybdopterin converting factor subunit 1
MRVTVQLFARLRELAGQSELGCEVPTASTVGDVWQALVETHGGFAALAGSVSCAVNDDFARMSTPVRDGDRVAFLPPVSGGSVGPR